MKRTSLVSASAFVLALLLGLAGPASAKGLGDRIVVTPENQQGWSTADTKPGGAVTFVVDSTAPSGRGALELTTDLTTTAKAQYLHATSTPLGSVTELSYYTKQNSALFAGGDPSYQVIALLNGTRGFTTLVFEPYQNTAQGPVVASAWQRWGVDRGLFWSTRDVTCSNGAIVKTPGGPSTYSLADIKTACPSAMVIGFGVNIGSNNPGYNVETDLLNFNGTVYDFEPSRPCDKGQSDHDGDKANCGNHFGQDGDEDDADD